MPVFIPGLTAMVGFWATLSLNMPDFTRFGRSQREQVIGQTVALPTTMFLFAAMGVLITSATTIIYGEVIWDPIKLVGRFSNPLVIAISMFTAVVATLAVNIAANVVSPANDFANAFPKLITFKTGGLITGIVGIAMQPWRLLADPSGYIFNWLVGYSGGLGSIAGVLIADYWIVRQTRARPRGPVRHRRPLRWLERGRHHRDARGLRDRLGRAGRAGRCGRSTTTPGSSGSRWPDSVHIALAPRSWDIGRMTPSLSFVIPLYNSAETIAPLVHEIDALTIPGGHEIVLVNDGSADSTPANVCRNLCGRAHRR